MPEADILAVTAHKLGQALVGHPLTTAELRWPSCAGVNLVGDVVTSSSSYGKHLLLRTDGRRTLHTHLRMEGFWQVAPTGSPRARGSLAAKYSHKRKDSGANGGPLEIRAVLANSKWTALGVALGMMDVLPTRDEPRLLGHLGPHVLSDDYQTEGAVIGAQNLRRYNEWPICAALLEQRVVAGLGTIWMAETLFATRVNPWRLVSSFDDDDAIGLLRTAGRLVGRSVAIGLSRSLSAVPRRVHGQHNRFCVRCDNPIQVSALSGPDARPDQGAFDRIVYWCPTCQPV